MSNEDDPVGDLIKNVLAKRAEDEAAAQELTKGSERAAQKYKERSDSADSLALLAKSIFDEISKRMRDEGKIDTPVNARDFFAHEPNGRSVLLHNNEMPWILAWLSSIPILGTPFQGIVAVGHSGSNSPWPNRGFVIYARFAGTYRPGNPASFSSLPDFDPTIGKAALVKLINAAITKVQERPAA